MASVSVAQHFEDWSWGLVCITIHRIRRPVLVLHPKRDFKRILEQ